jgi:hypothetical protein
LPYAKTLTEKPVNGNGEQNDQTVNQTAALHAEVCASDHFGVDASNWLVSASFGSSASEGYP